MFEKTIQIGEGDILTLVEMEGDVTIAGWDKAEVLIRLKEGTEEDLTVQETETGPAVSARRPCKVQVPTTMPVVVHQALKNLQVGQLVKFDAQQVRGNLQLDDVGNVTVGEAYGNLKANGADSLQLTPSMATPH